MYLFTIQHSKAIAAAMGLTAFPAQVYTNKRFADVGATSRTAEEGLCLAYSKVLSGSILQLELKSLTSTEPLQRATYQT